MFQRRNLIASLAAALLIPVSLRAADPIVPEKLLAKDSLFYLRYDGLDAHRKAYDETVLARLIPYMTRLASARTRPFLSASEIASS